MYHSSYNIYIRLLFSRFSQSEAVNETADKLSMFEVLFFLQVSSFKAY